MYVFLKMANVQMTLFLYMLVGVICQKKQILNYAVREKLTDIVFRITLPCMIFKSFCMEFDWAVLRQGSLALLAAAGIAVMSLVLGKILYPTFPPEEKCVLQYGTLVSNSGFVGLSVVSGVYGNTGLFLGSLFIIPTRILMWSAGISLFTKAPMGEKIKKVVLNPAIIAVELGLVWMFLQLPLPGFLDQALDGLGGCTSPMAMVLVGAILADVPLRSAFAPKIFYLVAVRQILLPGLSLIILRALRAPADIIGISVVLTGMPIGSTTAILAQKYGANAQFASKCIFVSTLTSLITVPILTMFLP